MSVAVLPTRASVQGLAALAVHDAGRTFEDDVIAMTAAARATRHAEVAIAQEEALTSAGVCRPGDVLGFVEGDVATIGPDVVSVGKALIDRLLAGGGELVTVVCGSDTDGVVVDQLRAHVQETYPGVDTIEYDGGQARFPLLLGVE
jgi:dihydroxyacetone kinase-like predicted kinase